MKYLLPLILFLAGCAHVPDKEYIEVPVYIKVVCDDFKHIDSIKTLPVIFVNGVDTEGYQVLGLRGDSYSNLAINSAETLRYIKEQINNIRYYETCIENHNSRHNEKSQP